MKEARGLNDEAHLGFIVRMFSAKPGRYRIKTLSAGVNVDHVTVDVLSQRGHVLRVLDNRQPRAMLMSLDALESFQHLVTFDRQSTCGCIYIGKYRTPDRMRVQNGACASFPHYTNVQRTLVRRLARM